MRVTNKMLANNYLSDMNTNMQNMKTLQQQMASGKNFRKPSDDPFNVARAMQMHSQINTNTQYNKNITNVINWLDTTDTALGQMGNVFQSIREKLVSAGNAAYGSNERSKIKDEINQRVSQVAQIANTSFDGEYIFGGTQGASKPVNAKQIYTFPKELSKSNSSGGEASLSGSYTGDKNLSYVISVTDLTAGSEKVKVSIDGGKTFASDISISSGEFDIGNGMKVGISFNSDNKVGDTYSFNTVEGTKLVYTNKDGDDLKLIEPMEIKIVSPKEWSDTTVTFQVKKQDGTTSPYIVELGALAQDPPTVDDIIKSLNDSINNHKVTSSDGTVSTPLKGTISINKTDDGKVKFVSLTNDSISMTATGADISTGVVDSTKKISDLDSSLGKEIPNYQIENLSGGRKTEISQGVMVEYNVAATDVLSYADGDNIGLLLERVINHLDGKVEKRDADGNIIKDASRNIIYEANEEKATSALTNKDLADLDKAMAKILKVRSEVGAKQNRMDSAKEQNEQANLDMTDILSKSEDVDITEKTMEFAMMQTVYLASLQTSAKVLQPTLMDYMR